MIATCKFSPLNLFYSKKCCYFAVQSTFIMTTTQHSEDLKHIRNLMERSSKFMGLSGWSLFAAGLIALAGMAVARFFVLSGGGVKYDGYMRGVGVHTGMDVRPQMALLAAVVLTCAVLAAFFFIVRKANKAGQSFWSLSAKRALLNFCIPFITGGIFCVALVVHGHIQFLPSAMLVFYGLALVNAGKFTVREVYYLGLCEIMLGLSDAFFIRPSLLFWVLGFGLANVVVGLAIYFKYDRK